MDRKKVGGALVAGSVAIGGVGLPLTWPHLTGTQVAIFWAVISVIAFAGLLMAFWPGRKAEEAPPANGQTTHGHLSPAIRDNYGTVQIGPPASPITQPEKSPYGTAHLKPSPSPRVPRKCPEMPIWKAVERVRTVLADNDRENCYPATLVALRQAALDERITIWGRKENRPSGLKEESWRPVWTAIPAGYWEDFEFTAFVTTDEYDSEHTWNPNVAGFGRGNRYRDLKVDQAEIEREWARPTEHRLVDRAEPPNADIQLKSFLGRIYKKLGWRPSGASQFQLEAFHRKVNLEILDAMSLHKLHVWGRVGDLATRPISPVEREFATIDHLKGELRSLGSEEDAIVWTDLRFVKAEVDKVWPPPARKNK